MAISLVTAMGVTACSGNEDEDGAGARAASSGPAAAPTRSVTIAVFSKDSEEVSKDLDLGATGESMGDRIVARGPLFDLGTTSARVGSFTGEIVTLETDSLLTRQMLALSLSDGQLLVAGSGLFTDVLKDDGMALAVVGGTGEYGTARGVCTTKSEKLDGDEGFTVSCEVELT
jgi:hypothetical protein